MKVAGYHLTSPSGGTSATAHESTLDFWLSEKDLVEPVFLASDVLRLLEGIAKSQFIEPELAAFHAAATVDAEMKRVEEMIRAKRKAIASKKENRNKPKPTEQWTDV